MHLPESGGRTADEPRRRRRRELVGQLERLRGLYVMGDLTEGEYVLRRQALEEELERTGPRLDPRLAEAEGVS